MEQSDRDILNHFKEPSGKERAFEGLVMLYQKALYRHIRTLVGNHMDADDALQNTFVKVWTGLSAFKGESALYTWLYRIATNEALTILRKRKQLNHVDDVPDHNRSSPSEIPSGDDISTRLHDAIATLPEKQRQVFDLKYFGEMKYEEIARITGTTVGGLKASYFHAVKKIEAYLDQF